MKKPTVYVTYPLPEEALQLLREHCDVSMNPDLKVLAGLELIEKIRNCDAVMVVSAAITDDVCQAVRENCKIFANYGVGYNNIDVAAATRNGIYVTNTPEVVTNATADLAFALLLATARRIVECDEFVRKGGKGWGPTNLVGTQVSGKTIGIIGGGRIGKAVAKRTLGFEMSVLYTDVRPNTEFEEATGGKFVDKDTLLREADFVSVHIPLLPGTRHFIGAEDLVKMKKTAIIINSARGPIIDEVALVQALSKREIAGAGLDVFEWEPELADGLANLANVVLAPHVGTSTLDTRIAMGEVCARNIIAAVSGDIPPACLNPQAKSK